MLYVDKSAMIQDAGNTYEAANQIASRGIDVLIDLNGLTWHSGLPVMSHRPASVQMSFLGNTPFSISIQSNITKHSCLLSGSPSTTAASFIDYFIGDFVALPAEHATHFTEKLVLMAPSYIVNDYAQLRGSQAFNFTPADKSVLMPNNTLEPNQIIFATFSNFQKFDPVIFTVWMNTLRSLPGSKLLILQHGDHEIARANLEKEAKAQGISSSRLIFSPYISWTEHVRSKTAVDIVLDTIIKNGHTSLLDAIWAGVRAIYSLYPRYYTNFYSSKTTRYRQLFWLGVR